MVLPIFQKFFKSSTCLLGNTGVAIQYKVRILFILHGVENYEMTEYSSKLVNYICPKIQKSNIFSLIQNKQLQNI